MISTKRFSQFREYTESDFPNTFSNLYVLGVYKNLPRKFFFDNFKYSAFRAYESRISTINSQITSVSWNDTKKEEAELNKSGVASSVIWAIDEAEHLSKNNIFYSDIIILNRPLSFNDRKKVKNNIKLAVNFKPTQPIDLRIENIKDFHTSNNSLENILTNDSILKTISLSEKAMKNVSNIDHIFEGCISLIALDGDYTFSNIQSAICGFKNCTNLISFEKNLSALENGQQMFDQCTNLTSFTASLASLIIGDEMFAGCKLNLASIQNIASTINNLTTQSLSGSITIGIQADLQDTDELNTALETIENKGWTVNKQYNTGT